MFVATGSAPHGIHCMQAAHEAKMRELRDASRRFQADASHQVEQERQAAAGVQAQLKRALDEKALAETRARKIEADFAAFRDKQAASPVSELHAAIARLQSEKAQAERARDTAAAAAETTRAQLFVRGPVRPVAQGAQTASGRGDQAPACPGAA